ncbi:unnamed protein product [Mucor hiemalis]
MSTPPEHPGNPKWQSYNDWIKEKTPTLVDYKATVEETREEQFERFGLTDEGGNGWGDASEAQDAGWGAPTGGGGCNP